MARSITQTDIGLLRQGSQELHLRAELLNESGKVLDSLEGIIINDNFSANGSSAQRRSYSCDALLTGPGLIPGRDGKLWMDKKLRIFYGIRSLQTDKIHWYLIGTFLYVSMEYQYSQSQRTVSLTCADLMARYDGTLNGQIGSLGSSRPGPDAARGLKIPAGEDIRQSVIATLKSAGITEYVVEDIGKEVPYDLEFSTGSTYCDVWKKLCELYDSWEFFFDADGTFVWQEIPNCKDDPVILDDTVLREIVADEKAGSSFENIYNVTEVWGKTLELGGSDIYASAASYSGNVFQISSEGLSSWENLDDLTQIGIRIPADSLAAPYFSINGFSAVPVLDGNGDPLAAGALKAGTDYVFRYRRKIGASPAAALYLLGQYQCYGKYVENSPDCPFSVPNLGYEILQSLDYESLSDDSACYNQAQYLTYASTAMMDTVTLTTLIIPWLKVNEKVHYTAKYSGETNEYIIKNFSWSAQTGTMTVTLYKFLESFSFVYGRRQKE